MKRKKGEKDMISTLNEIKAPADITYRLEEIQCEYEKMLTAITAFVEFCGIYNIKKNIADIQLRPQHFESLFTIIEDYSCEVKEALEELVKAAYEYNRTAKKA